MSRIKKHYLVQKRNVFNEIRANNMILQELRFFSIYLSKINKNDIRTRCVRFSITDFQSIMDLGRINIDYLRQVTNSLLCKVVNVPNENGGYTGFQIFKECTVDIDPTTNEWYIEIDAHDRALPLLFEYQSCYFSYRLWNALRLKSVNQLRMYEILKQYETIGTRILPIDSLKQMLGIGEDEYTRYNSLKKDVIDVCQQALQENTDIKFIYEPYGKKGKGGKIYFIKFTIQKNEGFKDPLLLDQFIGEREQPIDTDAPIVYDERMAFLSEACDNEFTMEEIIVLYDIMLERLSYPEIKDNLQCYKYLFDRYNYMKMRHAKTPITNRFRYMMSIVGCDI